MERIELHPIGGTLDVGSTCTMTGANGVPRWIVIVGHEDRLMIARPANRRDRVASWLRSIWWSVRYRLGWV